MVGADPTADVVAFDPGALRIEVAGEAGNGILLAEARIEDSDPIVRTERKEAALLLLLVGVVLGAVDNATARVDIEVLDFVRDAIGCRRTGYVVVGAETGGDTLDTRIESTTVRVGGFIEELSRGGGRIVVVAVIAEGERLEAAKRPVRDTRG